MHTRNDQVGSLELSDFWGNAIGNENLSTDWCREMLNALPAAVYTTDADGLLTYFNPACAALAGRTPILNHDRWCITWKLYHPDGTPMPPEQCPMANALNEGRALRGGEAIAERPDGTRVWFIPYPTPLRNTEGKIVGGINMLVDITERKQHEEALRHSEQKLQRVLETDAVAVLFFDSQGVLIDANDVFLRMTGYQREQIDRRELTWRTMTPPEWVEDSEKQFEQFAHTGRIGPHEKEYFLADGTRRWMRFAGRDLGDGTIAEICIDITDSKRREADSRALAALGTQMVAADKPEIIYQKMVDAAVGVMRSDFASMQLFHHERGEAGELELLAQHGFDPASTKFWQWVSGKSTCVCGLTLRDGARVLIPDAQQCDRLDDGQKTAYRNAAICAMQSTPLFSRSGKLLGMISTHWRRPHTPTENELSNFDILARQAADVIERSLAEHALRQNEAWLAAQKEALQSALNGNPLEHSLGALVRGASEHFGHETRTAFYRANSEGTALYHVVGMGAEYAKVIDGFEIGPESLACGLATYKGQSILTADVKEEPLWRTWLWAAEKFDFRGCWSFPLHTSQGKLLGTFTVYWRQPRRATPRDISFASAVTDTAAIIVSRHDEACVRQQATASLAHAKEEAEAANIAKDNFLATLSHELRTPLTPVLATLSSWEARRSFPAELSEDLEMVRRNVDLEARLIDDLLDLTRIAKGKITLNLEVLDAQKVLDSVVEMYRSEINAKRITLSLRRQATHRFVQGDPGRLQQIFWNILKNAVKFTAEGGNIDIATRDDSNGHVQITITDTGVGMNQDILRRVFEPFEQETAGRYGGLGLGLAITKALVEVQHGTIEARSDGPGKGASFIITLPCVNRPGATKLLSPPVQSARHFTKGAYRILLVEDHVDTARVLARLLAVNGHNVTTTHYIAEALSAIRGNDFDLLLSDIGLPDGTGIDLIRQVRQDLGKKTPAVALTGFGMEEDIKRTMQAGFNDHLTKPVNFARLEQTIQRACNPH
ncbi:MAG TPA: ATP-binding protein [Tepidisphaeraceae bacterium]|jgi:PAS domain S-box-containing protein